MAIISALVTQKCRIGVLTPYRAQQKLIDRMIKDEDLTASVDTIDASQGNCFCYSLTCTIGQQQGC